jgi:hypothetical protein
MPRRAAWRGPRSSATPDDSDFGPRSGLRFIRSLRLPSGPAGAAPLRSLRYRQTLGGLCVVWSKVDVAVTPRGVSSITATIVPVARGIPAGGRRIDRSRALGIARRHVRGDERTLSPQLVAYAGKPTVRAAKKRAARHAYVVEATAKGRQGGAGRTASPFASGVSPTAAYQPAADRKVKVR